jgi:hypothetical protein
VWWDCGAEIAHEFRCAACKKSVGCTWGLETKKFNRPNFIASSADRVVYKSVHVCISTDRAAGDAKSLLLKVKRWWKLCTYFVRRKRCTHWQKETGLLTVQRQICILKRQTF